MSQFHSYITVKLAQIRLQLASLLIKKEEEKYSIKKKQYANEINLPEGDGGFYWTPLPFYTKIQKS